MMKDTRKTIREALHLVDEGYLSDAMEVVRQLIADEPYLAKGEQLDDIRADYQRMLDYMASGYDDPQREHLYQDLLNRMYRFIINYETEWRCVHETLFGEARRHRLLMSYDEIRNVLENYVTDVAMNSLDGWSDADSDKLSEIYKNHQQLMSRLFYTLLISRQWRTTDADFYKSLILSPTIDANDAQVITAAVMLSCINEYDTLKFSTLAEVYNDTSDEYVRQRALVGCVLCMNKTLTPEEQSLIDKLIANEIVARDLIDLQKQLLFTVSAEKDNETIQRDIMPTLIKNNQFSITRDGIVEKEDDPMQDILDPDADDRKMEEVEEMLRQMQQMQNAGSDVYFGGFSQMKRFPFFYDLSNWFTPFYIQHPGIGTVVEKLNSMQVMRNIAENGPFCDSDKYSFTLAISTILNQLPDNVKEMMSSADVLGPTLPPETMKTPTYIRRMYLQDLYRFFRLFHLCNELHSPFDDKGYLFLHDQRFNKMAINDFRIELARFYHQRHDGDGLVLTTRFMTDITNDSLYLRGICAYYYENDYDKAISHFKLLLEQQPDNIRVMGMLARCYMQVEQFEEAQALYSKLILMKPENKQYELNYCVALCKQHAFDDAVERLYRLLYEDENDLNIKRILAWALMGQKRLEQAREMYQQVVHHEHHEATDWLNIGYCDWFSKMPEEAVLDFCKYLKERQLSPNDVEQLMKDFDTDRQTLYDHGITSLDIKLMRDLVRGFREMG
ncbi:MAG: tetratricopeptide repeat protein [Prevotella sp.]|nr:tetratricopeptide repeat protein [Prevotella sp.]